MSRMSWEKWYGFFVFEGLVSNVTLFLAEMGHMWDGPRHGSKKEDEACKYGIDEFFSAHDMILDEFFCAGCIILEEQHQYHCGDICEKNISIWPVVQ